MIDLNNKIIKQALKKRKVPPKFRRYPFPKNIERAYNSDLQQIANAIIQQIRQKLLPILPSVAQDLGQPVIKKDAGADDITNAIGDIKNNLFRKYTDAELKAMAKRKGISLAQFTEEATKKEFKRVLGVDLFTNDRGLADTIEFFSINNMTLSKSLIEQSLDKAQATVFSGFQTGRRWEEIAKDIEKQIDPKVGNVVNRARLIARDQISKLNGQLTQERQTNLGVTKYIWRTSQDERVRDSHRELEGTTQSWDDPPSVGHPGEDINCRCTAEPVLDEFFE